MLEAVTGVDAEIAVMAAVVADFKPASSSPSKISRTDGLPSIDLTPTPDILASVVSAEVVHSPWASPPKPGEWHRAIEKAKRKGVDLLVYNDVTEPGSGFGTDTNRVVLVAGDGSTTDLPLLSKREVAEKLWDRIGVDAKARD